MYELQPLDYLKKNTNGMVTYTSKIILKKMGPGTLIENHL